MTYESPWRFSGGSSGGRDGIPEAPPLPTPRPLQRARDAATRFFGYQSRPVSPHESPEEDRYFSRGRSRYASLSATQNATASHKTGLGINTIAINEQGTHALLGGKEIFRTVKVEDGAFAVGFDLRGAIRSTPISASGVARHKYTIDIADVAWARGDCGDYVAAATSSGKIILYDLGHAGIQAAQLHEHFRQVHTVTFNPHRGCLLLSGSQDGTVRLWDVRDVRQASTLHSKRKYSGQSDGVRDVKWSPTEGVDFAFGTDSGWIQRWDIRNLKTAIVRIPAHSETCNAIDWHPDGKHIVSASSDKTVRVWDFSTGRRQQKASWEIQTPYRVLNARWRPACESTMPGYHDARQCTQLATTYDEDHPVVHIWDLRRPTMPFRELFPYASSPTDLLWHSQDLLWTVGREGTFMQTDIQYAPKVLDKRNMQAFTTSTFGDISFVAQKRQKQRITPQQRAQLIMASKDSSRSRSPQRDGMLSRSWADDGLDQSFLQSRPSKPDMQHQHSLVRASSVVTPSSNEVMFTRTLNLDEVLSDRESLRPPQVAFYGPLPYSLEPRLFAFLAKNYRVDVKDMPDDEEFLVKFEELLEHNAQVAQRSGLYRTAQTWRIVSFMILGHLKKRAESKLLRRAENSSPVRTSNGRVTLADVMHRLMSEANNSPLPSPRSIKPVSGITQQFARSDGTSDQATPVIQPSTNIDAILAEDQSLLELDQEETTATARPIAPSPSQDYSISPSQPLRNSQLTSNNLDGLQRLQQNTVEAHKRAMVRRWSIQPREPLNLDPVDANGVKIRSPKLERHASNESFTFLDGSANSRDPSFPSSYESRGSPLDMVAERPSRTAGMNRETANDGVEAQDFDDRRPLGDTGQHEQQVNHPDSPRIVVGATTQNNIEASENLELGVKRPPKSANDLESDRKQIGDRLENPVLKKAERTNRETTRLHRSQATTNDASNRRHSLYFPDESDEDIEHEKPFALVEMVHELVVYYASKGDAQTATQLLLVLCPLLPQTRPLSNFETTQTISAYMDFFTNAGYTLEEMEAVFTSHFESTVRSGMQPLQIEAVLSTYHDQLVSRQLFNEAALLRRLAYPMYPSVYEDSVADNHVHMKCGSCGKPLSTGAWNLHCDSCGSKQDQCAFCSCNESPYDAPEKKSKLRTTCLKCNHSTHAACLREWCSEGDGGCPVEGCLCDCVEGSWREQKEKERMLEAHRRAKSHGRVRSDELVVKESRAVEGARSFLKDSGKE